MSWHKREDKQGVLDATRSEYLKNFSDIESHQFQEKRNEVPTAVNETPVFLALMQITRVSLET